MNACPSLILLCWTCLGMGGVAEQDASGSGSPPTILSVDEIELDKSEAPRVMGRIRLATSNRDLDILLARRAFRVTRRVYEDGRSSVFSSTMLRYELVSQQDPAFNWSFWTPSAGLFRVHNEIGGKPYATFVEGYRVHVFELLDSNDSNTMLAEYLSRRPQGNEMVLNVGQLVGTDGFRGGTNALYGFEVEQLKEKDGHLRVAVSGLDIDKRPRHYIFEFTAGKWNVVDGEHESN